MAKDSFFHFAQLVLRETSNERLKNISFLKYYWQWRKSLQSGRNAIADELPWIIFPAIDFLREHINKNSLVFEYGAGGSSLFFIKLAKEVVTIEHHENWFHKIQVKVQQNKDSNWVGKLIPPEKKTGTEQLDPSNPNDYFTNEEPYINYTFKSYVTYIDKYPDDHFDLVMIDGRSRASCIAHSMPKVKPGGYLLVDNSNRRSYFTEVKGKLDAGFELIFDQKAPGPYLNYLTQTAIWRKKLTTKD